VMKRTLLLWRSAIVIGGKTCAFGRKGLVRGGLFESASDFDGTMKK